MLLRLIQMGIGNLFVLGVTIHLFRLLRTTVPHLDIPIFGFLWIFSATLFTFLLGIFGFLAPAPMALVSLIGLLLMGLHVLRHRSRYVDTFSFPHAVQAPKIHRCGWFPRRCGANPTRSVSPSMSGTLRLMSTTH